MFNGCRPDGPHPPKGRGWRWIRCPGPYFTLDYSLDIMYNMTTDDFIPTSVRAAARKRGFFLKPVVSH
ncbi:hypothetical protein DWX59_21630 [Enterocloster aldenensis]|nr:hypothetical protein [Clostridiales bacterium AHG0011]RGC23969.1 hypothetical protein DWX59_21630 [Enterocloster aldenensis]RGC61516.1 hypothetical protein DW690_11945 [Dorea longicatena]